MATKVKLAVNGMLACQVAVRRDAEALVDTILADSGFMHAMHDVDDMEHDHRANKINAPVMANRWCI